jgi:hypothetical protein
MTAATSPAQPVLTIRRGDTLYFRAQLFQDPVTGRYATAHAGDVPPPGMAPANIAGFVIMFTAKDDSAIPDAQAPIRLDNAMLGGIVITSASLGQFSVTGSQTLTVGFADGTTPLEYDVQVIDLRGNVFTVEEGLLDVVADITRAISPWVPGQGPGPIAPQQGGVGPAGPPGLKGDKGDAGPSGPPGPSGSLATPGVDVVGPTTYAVRPGDAWVRCNTTSGVATLNLDSAGTTDGELHIASIAAGANGAVFTSSHGIGNPATGTIVGSVAVGSLYGSLTVRWSTGQGRWFLFDPWFTLGGP